MPCTSEPHAYCHHERNECLEIKDTYIKSQFDLLTSFLCEILTDLEKLNMVIENPELKAWWERHKKFDRERKDEPVLP